MKNKFQFLLLIFLSLLISCSKEKDSPSPIDPDNPTANNKASIVVLYTNDEHGWMEKTNSYSGAAGMFEMWQTKEGYNSADSFLVLSGGDMWTGPAISTWFKGKSMVEVMNEMEYDAAALGNHEFDYSVSTLTERLQEMEFPLIAANVTEKSSGNIPAFVSPYIIKNVDGIKVGLIGLASQSTPTSAFPAYVEDYNFTSYSEAIETYAPKAIADGANVLFIIGHISKNEMLSLVNVAKVQGVSLIAGGHSHEQVSTMVDGIMLIESGSKLTRYVKVVIEYDKTNHDVEIKSYKIERNNTQESNTEVNSIVDYWKTQVDNELSENIGYCSSDIEQYSDAMFNMITDSWLFAYPNADVSMTNSGGIRQSIPQGDITLESIVGVLPFQNTLYEIKLTGNELIDCIDYYIVGGMTTVGGYRLSDGRAINPTQVYSVLTTDYLYSLENSKFAQYDDNPYNTSIGYMQPTIEWIKSLNTTAQNPLNNYLDFTARK